MNMSKAFHTVDRKTLLEDLKRIVNPDELHLIKILLDEVKLAVRVGKTTGELFQTNVGVPQGGLPIADTIHTIFSQGS